MLESVLVVLKVLGGVGLFLFGMELVTRSLLEGLGSRLRLLLQRVTSNRVLALLGGAAVASMLFSGPTTVMVVSFVNAGLVTMLQAIPMIFGANVGTTIALQIIAFDLSQYALIAVGLAMGVRIFIKNETAVNVATAVLGFGLLFLGLGMMSGALAPVKDSALFRAWLAMINASSIGGLLFGIFISMLMTSLIMSSGAMIAIAFALASIGLIHDFNQAFPILLGAHVGTCIITIIGSIGTNASAKRTALTHLTFNICGTILALTLMPLWLRVIPQTSDNVVRQIANGHSLIQLTNALVFLPFTGLFAKFLEWLVPVKAADAEQSYLDPQLARTPELAILMVVKEMRRQARICERMLHTSMEAMLSLDLSRFQSVKQDENAVDHIKHALDDYVVRIGERQLSRRQSLLLQHLVASSNDLERIADHIETIGLLTRTKVNRGIWFEDKSMLRLVELGKLVSQLLSLTVDSLDPTQPDARETAQRVLELRKEYKRRAAEIKDEFNSRFFEGAEDAVTGMFFMRYITVFDRIIRHIRGIARVELTESFTIETVKLAEVAPIQKPIRTMQSNGTNKIDERALFVESERDKD